MRALSVVLIAICALLMLPPASAASGWSALVRTDLNLRKGPGIDYPAIGLVSRQSRVLVHSCGYHRYWCSISYKGKTGFVMGRYLVRLAKPRQPRLDKAGRRTRLLEAMRSRSLQPLARHRAPVHDLDVPWRFGSGEAPKRFGYPHYGYPHYGYRPYGHQRYGYRLYGYR